MPPSATAMNLKILILGGLLVPFAVGCNGGGGGAELNNKETEMSSRLDKLAKQTGGDWNKLSEADKTYMVNELGRGSEQSAKMLLSATAGNFSKKSPGGPPKP